MNFGGGYRHLVHGNLTNWKRTLKIVRMPSGRRIKDQHSNNFGGFFWRWGESDNIQNSCYNQLSSCSSVKSLFLKIFRYSPYFIDFYWNILALQCHVSFCCTMNGIQLLPWEGTACSGDEEVLLDRTPRRLEANWKQRESSLVVFPQHLLLAESHMEPLARQKCRAEYQRLGLGFKVKIQLLSQMQITADHTQLKKCWEMTGYCPT